MKNPINIFYNVYEKCNIYNEYKDGATQEWLAYQYGCSYGRMRKITNEIGFVNGVEINKSSHFRGRSVYVNPIIFGDE